ncbi:MAG TPA: hypothetical protein VGF36_02410 [Rhodopila sp.]
MIARLRGPKGPRHEISLPAWIWIKLHWPAGWDRDDIQQVLADHCAAVEVRRPLRYFEGGGLIYVKTISFVCCELAFGSTADAFDATR